MRSKRSETEFQIAMSLMTIMIIEDDDNKMNLEDAIAQWYWETLLKSDNITGTVFKCIQSCNQRAHYRGAFKTLLSR